MSELHLGNKSAVKWTVEHDATLRTCLEEKMSFSEATAWLNCECGTQYSRNAVIGRAARLKLVSLHPRSRAGSPNRVARPKRERKPRTKVSTPKNILAQPTLTREEITLRCVEVIPLNLTLFELGEGQCRYPYGDAAPYLFCGHKKLTGFSYCVPHVALTIGPGTASERRATEVAA